MQHGADAVLLQRTAGAPLERRFIDLGFTPLRDAQGKINGIGVHGVKQTHRKLAEMAVQENHERLLLATESTDLGLWHSCSADNIVAWENPQPYAITGIQPGDPPMSRQVRHMVHLIDMFSQVGRNMGRAHGGLERGSATAADTVL